MLGGVGMGIADVSVKNMNLSAVTGVSSGALRSCQSGISSFRLRGSRTAPDKICATLSLPFSIRQTSIVWPASAASCFKRIAADSPEGPPPTTTTSNSIISRSIEPLPPMLRPAAACLHRHHTRTYTQPPYAGLFSASR